MLHSMPRTNRRLGSEILSMGGSDTNDGSPDVYTNVVASISFNGSLLMQRLNYFPELAHSHSKAVYVIPFTLTATLKLTLTLTLAIPYELQIDIRLQYHPYLVTSTTLAVPT